MDRRLLTERTRLLGIPILIPVVALALVGYGMPDRDEGPGQQVVVIKLKKDGPECSFAEGQPQNSKPGSTHFRVHVKREVRIKFVKTGKFPGGQLLVFIPNNAGLEGAASAQQETPPWRVLDGTEPNPYTTNTILAAEDPDVIYYYDVYVGGSKMDQFCEGHSHPGIIVE